MPDPPQLVIASPWRRRPLLVPLFAATALVLIALLTTGGDLSTASGTAVSTAWVDAVLILAGGCAGAALVLYRRDAGGRLSFALFTAVAVLTALSIAWSVAPDQSWEEAGRTAAYLAAFGAAIVAARFSRASSRGAVLAVTLAALALCVWALAVKVFSLDLYQQDCSGPLWAPFSYWDSTGLTGAIAIPGLVWLAAGTEERRLTRGLASAGIAIAATVVVLSYSRSALAAALIGTIVPLFFLAARRRAVVMLLIGVAAPVPTWIYALKNHNVAGDRACSLYGADAVNIHRTGPGLLLGLFLLVTVAVLIVAGVAVSRYTDTPQPAQRLRLFDRGLAAALAAVPALVVLWLLVNSRGPFGEISHLWTSLTSVKGTAVGDSASRLSSLANSRALYYRQAFAVGKHHLLSGAGAGTIYPAYLRYPPAALEYAGNYIHEAHSYLFETFADLGLAGLLLNAALFIAWCRDARRALRVRLDRAPGAAEIDARWALIGVVIAFGASSALDYTWFFPGVAVPALVAAGWVAGVSASSRSDTAQLASAGPRRPAGAPPRPLAARPAAIIALTAIGVVSALIAWESFAPVRSNESASASASAQVDGDFGAAVRDARAAISQDPLSVAALERLATLYGSAGDASMERAELMKATTTQPENPQPFAVLGAYLACRTRDSDAAQKPLRRAVTLDVTDGYSQREMLTAAQAHKHPSQTDCENLI